jgi:hypothetical protein
MLCLMYDYKVLLSPAYRYARESIMAKVKAAYSTWKLF